MRNGGTAMKPRKTIFILSAALVALCAVGAATITASPQQNSAPAATGGAGAAPASQRPGAQAGSDALHMPASKIIRKFADNESQFKRERDNYTYSQSVLVEAS